MQKRVRHTKPDAIWLFDYPSFAAMDDCPELIMCISERDLQIILQSTKDIDRFQSRVFVESENDSYLTVDDTQFETFQGWVSDMFNNLGSYQMCNEYLQRIALALEGMEAMNNCCGGIEGVAGGSAGGGMEPAPPSDTEDTPESHEGPPPVGYASWEEFDQLKCDWANYIVDQMGNDILTMAAITVGTQSATALAAILVPLLVTPVGWVIILEIAVVMLAATLTVGFYTWVHDNLTENRDGYLCALFSGSNVGDSISNFATMVDEKIGTDPNFNALTGYWASSILKSLASIDSVNRMYQAQSFVPPTGDCSMCVGDGIWSINTLICTPTVVSGSFQDGEDTVVDSCEGNYFGTTRAGHNTGALPLETDDRDVLIVDVIGGGDFYVTWRIAGVDTSDEFSAAELEGHTFVGIEQLQVIRLAASDTTPFTITYNVTLP